VNVAYGTLERLPRLSGGPVLILIGEAYRQTITSAVNHAENSFTAFEEDLALAHARR
jgi:hypothetical protein